MSIARNIATVGAATLLSRLLGFLRDMGIAAVLGAGVMSDAYFAALQMPNLFRRLLAEGAVNSAFVPMWMRIHDKDGIAGTRRFAENTLLAVFLALALIAMAAASFAPALVRVLAPGFAEGSARFTHTVLFVQLSAPYIAVAGIVSIASAILNAEGRVAAASLGLVVFNGIMVLAVGAVAVSPELGLEPGAFLSAAIVAAGFGQLLLVGGALMRLATRPRRARLALSQETRRFIIQAIPGVVAGGIPQLKLMAGAMVASSSPAAVSWLYYANRLYELPLGVVSVAIAAVLVPQIAASVRQGSPQVIGEAQARGFEIALGLALPSAVAFAMLAEAIAGGLFERGAFGPHDTAMVAAALAAIAAGLPGHVIEKMFGAVSFAHEDTRTPMIAALCGLAVATVGTLSLFPRHGHVGVAAAIAISGWVGASILGAILWRRGWLHVEARTWRRLGLIVAAAAAMGVVLLYAKALLPAAQGAAARSGGLIVLVVVGLAVYLAAVHAFGVARLDDLAAAMRARLDRR